MNMPSSIIDRVSVSHSQSYGTLYASQPNHLLSLLVVFGVPVPLLVDDELLGPAALEPDEQSTNPTHTVSNLLQQTGTRFDRVQTYRIPKC